MNKNLKKIVSFLVIVSLLISSMTPLPIKAKENRIHTILDEMTLREKILQMVMVDFRKWDSNLQDNQGAADFVEMNDQVEKIISTYNFGAVLYFANNIQSAEQTCELTRDFQDAAMENGGIPMMVAADQEGGRVYRIRFGTALPGNMALGAAGEKQYAEQAGCIVGSELSALGINMNLAPVVDVNNNANNPVIGIRSYGDDAEKVGNMAASFTKGMNTYDVIGCAKHFPGHGDTNTDSHYGLPSVNKSKKVLLENELKPYQALIDQGIDAIMTAHILYPQLDNEKIYSQKTGKNESIPATMSKTIVTGLLKQELGFDGIVITDSMRMNAIAKSWGQEEAVIHAINAGIDMICTPFLLYDSTGINDLEKIIEAVENAVEKGIVKKERIDDAVTRILTVKEKRGILDYNSNNISAEKAKETVASDYNKNLEREIAAAAVTVVKNEDSILPLRVKENTNVLMLCPNEGDYAQLNLGWERAKNENLIPDGVTVEYGKYSNAELTDALKNQMDKADVVFLISELSSASKMSNFVNYANKNGKKCIVISVEKPYDIQLYKNADAIMAVYGYKSSDGAYGPNITAGVEVALGIYDARGKLPVNVPKFDEKTKTYTNEIIYPRGYGVMYNSLLVKEISAPSVTADNERESGKVRISWEPVENAYKYEVYCSRNKNSGYSKLITTTKSSYIHKNAVAGRLYYYKVRAYDNKESVVSDYSKVCSRTCDIASPQISLSNNSTTGKIKISWEKVSQAKLYEIYRVNTADGTYKKIGTTKSLGFTNTSITAGKTYYYKVRALSQMAAANSAYSNVKKGICKLARPVVKISSSNRKIKLTWKKVKDAQKYEIYRSITKNGTYKKVATTKNLKYTSSSLKRGKTYYYKVRAIYKNNEGNSTYSKIVYKKIVK